MKIKCLLCEDILDTEYCSKLKFTPCECGEVRVYDIGSGLYSVVCDATLTSDPNFPDMALCRHRQDPRNCHTCKERETHEN